MELKKITKDNLALAVKLARQIFPYEIHKEGFWPEVAYKESIQENKSNFAYYIAFEDNKAVGITGHYPPEDDKPEIWLGWFGILPEYRKRGYGQLLLQRSCDIIRDFGCLTLHLYSGNREEERAAHRLYIKNRFTQYKKGKVDGDPVLYFKKCLIKTCSRCECKVDEMGLCGCDKVQL